MTKPFYWDGQPGTGPGTAPDEYYVWDCDNNCAMPGWYVIKYDEPCGPFDSEQAATEWEHGQEWTGSPDPLDPDNFWIDDKTGERVNALTGERSKPNE